MGTRQTAQPLGVAIAALALPSLARAHGVHAALLFPALLCGLAALAVLALVANPPRPERAADAPPDRSPYRGSWRLARVHVASSLLVVPQFAVATFTLAYLVGQRHWDPATAGRIASGVWSDRVRSRLRPMRQLAVASAALMVLLAVGAELGAGWVVVAFGLGAIVTVADNGLAYTSVAELAGSEWSGRALGAHNTMQNVASVATAPVLAAIIGGAGYPLGFALVAICPLLAVPLTPVRAERRAPERAYSVGGG
jgi:sugar phosphate permease